MFLQVNIKDGLIVLGRDKLKELIRKAPDGIYTMRFNYTSRPKTINECRKHYFFYCELIATEGNTGYKTKEIHDLFKKLVLPNLPNLNQYINNPMDYIIYNKIGGATLNYSTKMLNLEGWYIFLEGVKQYSKENLDFLL